MYIEEESHLYHCHGQEYVNLYLYENVKTIALT